MKVKVKNKKTTADTLLDKLIQDKGKTRDIVAWKISEVELRGREGEESYQAELEKKFLKNKGLMSDYGNNVTSPSFEKLVILIDIIPCTLKEIRPTLKLLEFLKIAPYSKGEKSDNCTISSKNSEPLIIIPKQVINANLIPLPEELYAQTDTNKFEDRPAFIIDRIYLRAEYTLNPNTLTWTKYYLITSKTPYLKWLKHFDYFDCKRDGHIHQELHPEGLFKIHYHDILKLDKNEFDIELEKPLMMNDQIEIGVTFVCENVIYNDMGFHFTWLPHSTNLLLMEIVPPEPENYRIAELFVNNFRGRNFANERLKMLDLDKDLKSFIVKIKPCMNTSIEICWRR